MSRTPASQPPRRFRTYSRHPALQHQAAQQAAQDARQPTSQDSQQRQQPPQRPRAPRNNHPPRPQPSGRAFEASFPALPGASTTTNNATGSDTSTSRQQLTIWDIIQATDSSTRSSRGLSRRPTLTQDQLETFAVSLARVLNGCARAFERVAAREAESERAAEIAIPAVVETLETAELSEAFEALGVSETARATTTSTTESGPGMAIPVSEAVPVTCEEVFTRPLLWTVVRDCEEIMDIMTIGFRYSGFKMLVEANQVALMMLEQDKRRVEAEGEQDSE